MGFDFDVSELWSPKTCANFFALNARIGEGVSVHEIQSANLLQQTSAAFHDSQITSVKETISFTPLARTSTSFSGLGNQKTVSENSVKPPRLSLQIGQRVTTTIQSLKSPKSCKSPQNPEQPRRASTERLQDNLSLQYDILSAVNTGPYVLKNGAQLLDWIFPEATERFSVQSGTCVAQAASQRRRCAKTIADKRIIARQIADARSRIERLAKLKYPEEATECFKELDAIQNLIFCKRFHRKIAWQEVIASKNSQSAKANASQKKHPPSTKLSKTINTQPSQRPKWKGHIQNLKPYRPKSSGTDDLKHIMRVVSKALLPTELKPGRIYVYWIEGNFGCRKIGLTYREVDVRFQEWVKQCGHKVNRVYPLETDNVGLIQHASRLEKIIHAEFISHRYTEQCGKCGKKHKEWFQASDEHIRAVIKKWSDWIATDPYQEIKNDHLGSSEWHLKKQHSVDLKSLCQPLEYTVPKPLPKSRKSVTHALRRSSRLANKRASQGNNASQRPLPLSDDGWSDIEPELETKSHPKVIQGDNIQSTSKAPDQPEVNEEVKTEEKPKTKLEQESKTEAKPKIETEHDETARERVSQESSKPSQTSKVKAEVTIKNEASSAAVSVDVAGCFRASVRVTQLS